MWTVGNIKSTEGKITTGSQILDKMVLDIASGICGNHTLTKGGVLSDTKKFKQQLRSNKNYTISNIINEELESSNYREAYKWKGDKEFISEGINFKIIKYDITTGEYCFVEMDGVERRLTKKCLKGWYDSREEII